MLKFDVLFIDSTCPWPYDSVSVETESSGGTETCVGRISEGLADLGLKVAVIERHQFDPIIGKKVYFLPWEYLGKVQADVVIHLRSVNALHLFPTSKQIIWLHDLGTKEILDQWQERLDTFKPLIITISDWHEKHIRSLTNYTKIKTVFSPVDETFYVEPANRPAYKPYHLMWMSSPHKGLEDALRVFARLRSEDSRYQLLVTNPGYLGLQAKYTEGVTFCSKMPRRQLREALSTSLCLFYPTSFEETFGFVAAEANAIGAPVASYNVAALPEIVNHPLAKDEDDLIKTVLQWSTNGRPIVTGQDKFRIKHGLKGWLKAFDEA